MKTNLTNIQLTQKYEYEVTYLDIIRIQTLNLQQQKFKKHTKITNRK